MQAMLILLMVGLLISSWLGSGVIPAMIYYGLAILKPGIFLIAACLICSIVSLATGSSWGTAGTMGIALIGIGQGLGISPAIAAGAIVSGAYFGDKMSPLSDTTNLAPAVAGATLFEHIRHMVWTVTPSLIIALIIYAILGATGTGGSAVDMDLPNAIRLGLTESFNINPLLLLPPVVVIVIVALRLPAVPGLIGGVLLGCILGALFNPATVHFADWFETLHYGFEYEVSDSFFDAAAALGYSADTVAEAEDMLMTLLSRGGMEDMMWTINLILCALCFGGVMDASGMLGTLAESLLKVVKNTGSLVAVTVFSCIFMNIIASDQYLAIILPARMYKQAFEDRRLQNKNLSRCCEDAGTMTSSLVPWNTCGATMSKFLGVPTLQYFKFAYLNLLNPLISIFYGYTGISMTKTTDEEYERILQQRAEDQKIAMAVLEG